MRDEFPVLEFLQIRLFDIYKVSPEKCINIRIRIKKII